MTITGDYSLDDLIDRDQGALERPYPIFAGLREGPPTFSDSLGAWAVTRYDDVLTVLHDTEHFSSQPQNADSMADNPVLQQMMKVAAEPEMAAYVQAMVERQSTAKPVLLSADPPDHVRQRKLVNGAFRPSRLRGLEPVIDQVATALLDKFVDTSKERCETDIVESFAVGVPMTLIAYALGVVDSDLDAFKRWSDALVMPVGNPSPSAEEVREYMVSLKEFDDFFIAKLAERKAEPIGDIISDLATAELDGEELSIDEQLGMLQQFLVAGNETTTKLLTNMVLHLARDPELQERVRNDRSLIDPLIEEALRYEAPVGGLYRYAKTDIDIGGAHFRQGDMAWVVYASANRDDARFSAPDVFDIDRSDARDHVAFGHGEHFCIGAGLARAEARGGINHVLDRMGDIRLSENNDFVWADSYVLRGLLELNVTFTPIPTAS